MHREGGPVGLGGLDVDAATVCGDDPVDDEETEAEVPPIASTRLPGVFHPVKDGSELRLGNDVSMARDRDRDFIAIAPGLDANRLRRRTVLHGVAHQVGHGLSESLAVPLAAKVPLSLD